MNIQRVEREVTYLLTDEAGNDHRYSIVSTCKKGDDSSVTTIFVDNRSEGVEVPTAELPFLIESLRMFIEDYKDMNSEQAHGPMENLKNHRL